MPVKLAYRSLGNNFRDSTRVLQNTLGNLTNNLRTDKKAIADELENARLRQDRINREDFLRKDNREFQTKKEAEKQKRADELLALKIKREDERNAVLDSNRKWNQNLQESKFAWDKEKYKLNKLEEARAKQRSNRLSNEKKEFNRVLADTLSKTTSANPELVREINNTNLTVPKNVENAYNRLSNSTATEEDKNVINAYESNINRLVNEYAKERRLTPKEALTTIRDRGILNGNSFATETLNNFSVSEATNKNLLEAERRKRQEANKLKELSSLDNRIQGLMPKEQPEEVIANVASKLKDIKFRTEDGDLRGTALTKEALANASKLANEGYTSAEILAGYNSRTGKFRVGKEAQNRLNTIKTLKLNKKDNANEIINKYTRNTKKYNLGDFKRNVSGLGSITPTVSTQQEVIGNYNPVQPEPRSARELIRRDFTNLQQSPKIRENYLVKP